MERVYTIQEIEAIHLGKNAKYRQIYIDVDGNKYIGTIDNYLRILFKASEVPFSPTNAIPQDNVQGAIEGLSSRVTVVEKKIYVTPEELTIAVEDAKEEVRCFALAMDIVL